MGEGKKPRTDDGAGEEGDEHKFRPWAVSQIEVCGKMSVFVLYVKRMMKPLNSILLNAKPPLLAGKKTTCIVQPRSSNAAQRYHRSNSSS